MPRWEPDGAERLQAAALELFVEQGFERTTVAQIASRAGLTPRTFFNHYSDKREVLFGLSTAFEQKVLSAVAACPPETPALEAVLRGLAAADAMFDGRRAAVSRRQKVIAEHPGLQERELGKHAALVGVISRALQARGEAPENAFLAASLGMLAQDRAVHAWKRPDEVRSLAELLGDALADLRAVLCPSASVPRLRTSGGEDAAQDLRAL